MTLAKEWKEEGIKIGQEKGIKIGQEKGRHEEKIFIARNLKRLGVPFKQICIASGLTESEIDDL